jgi:hypothetical protein
MQLIASEKKNGVRHYFLSPEESEIVSDTIFLLRKKEMVSDTILFSLKCPHR